MKSTHHLLFIIVLAQFCCTSLWFAGNGVMADLVANFQLGDKALGHLTAAVQLGFIGGTLFFALLNVADRFAPSKVFFICAMAGAMVNLGMFWEQNTLYSLLGFRLLTGFFLAGIYPVGMKIAADHFEKGLGKSLGFLVGALVLGTAFPHLLKEVDFIPWKMVLTFTSALAVSGGAMMLFGVPEGPYRKPSLKLDLSVSWKVFQKPEFRSAAFGYFGHMWELYAFWAFVPVILSQYASMHPGLSLSVPLLSFMIIGIGGPACVLGGFLSQKFGEKQTAGTALFLSGACCLLSPLVLMVSSHYLLIVFLLFWGMTVVADSPLFSTLVANNAPSTAKGTALTIVNCIGFSITVLSIQLLNFIQQDVDYRYLYGILAIGPGLGLWALFWERKAKKISRKSKG